MAAGKPGGCPALLANCVGPQPMSRGAAGAERSELALDIGEDRSWSGASRMAGRAAPESLVGRRQNHWSGAPRTRTVDDGVDPAGRLPRRLLPAAKTRINELMHFAASNPKQACASDQIRCVLRPAGASAVAETPAG